MSSLLYFLALSYQLMETSLKELSWGRPRSSLTVPRCEKGGQKGCATTDTLLGEEERVLSEWRNSGGGEGDLGVCWLLQYLLLAQRRWALNPCLVPLLNSTHSWYRCHLDFYVALWELGFREPAQIMWTWWVLLLLWVIKSFASRPGFQVFCQYPRN